MPDRGAADPVSVQATVDDEDVEYLADDDTVRYVARRVRRKDGVEDPERPPEPEPIYRTVPFERWAPPRCANVGVERVREVVRERLGSDLAGVGSGAPIEESSPVVRLRYTTSSGRAEATGEEPSVSYERLVAVTPASVTVTVTLDGRTATHTMRVEVERADSPRRL